MIIEPVTVSTRWLGSASMMVVLARAPSRLTALSSVTLVMYVPAVIVMLSPFDERSMQACKVVEHDALGYPRVMPASGCALAGGLSSQNKIALSARTASATDNARRPIRATFMIFCLTRWYLIALHVT